MKSLTPITAQGPRAAVFGLFLALALAAMMIKGIAIIGMEDGLFPSPFTGAGAVCNNELRPCLRFAAPALGLALEQGVQLALKPLFWGMSRAQDAWTPWPIPETETLVRQMVAPYVAYLLYGILCLSALLWAARRLYPQAWMQAGFLVAAFAGFWGWHPSIVGLWFDLAGMVADWPRSYYLFSQLLWVYDFASLALVTLAIMAASGRTSIPLWAMAGLAIIGQWTLEHMGFVLGLTLVAGALAADLQARRPMLLPLIARLAATGAGSLAGAVIVVAGFYMMGHHTAMENAPEGASIFSRYLTNNLAWFKVVLANVITMTVLGAAGGMVVGLVAGLAGGGDAARAARLAWAAAGCLLAYAITMMVGMLFLAYPSEMGRQFAPMALAAFFMGAQGIEAAVLSFRQR